MVKMVNLARTKAEVAAENRSLGQPGEIANVPAEDEGVTVHLGHHHLKKLKVEGGFQAGDKVTFHGDGVVHHAESRATKDGDRHSATLRLSRGALEREESHERGEEADRADIRRGLTSAYDKAEKYREEKAELGKGRAGKEVKEKA